MGKVTLDYSKAAKFIREDEIKAFAPIVDTAKEVLLSRSGQGNDYLGMDRPPG